MNLYDLPGIGDVVPMTVGFPTFGDNLNEDAAGGRLWNMGNALHVGLDVDFRFFVLDQTILLRFEIDAGVFNGLVGVAAGDFDSETRNLRGGGRFFRRRGLLRRHGNARGKEEQSERS